MAAADVLGYAAVSGAYTDQREQLIMEHLPQVKWIATRIHDKLGGSVALDDLYSTGVIGLIHAVDSFDPSFNVKLKTYAEHKIRGAILDSIRGLDGIPAHKRKRAKEVAAAIVRAENRLQRSATEEEIAAELNLPLNEYQATLAELQAVSLGSLDYVPEGSSESSLMRLLPQDEEEQPSKIFERAELEKLLAEAIAKMPPQERTILSLYFQEEQNLSEIAEIMDVHRTRVFQLKGQALMRLRAYMIKKWPAGRGRY